MPNRKWPLGYGHTISQTCWTSDTCRRVHCGSAPLQHTLKRKPLKTYFLQRSCISGTGKILVLWVFLLFCFFLFFFPPALDIVLGGGGTMRCRRAIFDPTSLRGAELSSVSLPPLLSFSGWDPGMPPHLPASPVASLAWRTRSAVQKKKKVNRSVTGVRPQCC